MNIEAGDAFDRITARVTDEQKTEVASRLDRLDELEALKAENERLKKVFIDVEKTLNDEAEEIRQQRRFEAAKAAMQGMLAGGWNVHDWETGIFSVKHADALLKALEEQK